MEGGDARVVAGQQVYGDGARGVRRGGAGVLLFRVGVTARLVQAPSPRHLSARGVIIRNLIIRLFNISKRFFLVTHTRGHKFLSDH